MTDQRTRAADLRQTLEDTDLWRLAHAHRKPRIFADRIDRVVQFRSADSELWVSVAAGGVFEIWQSERGNAQRIGRTQNVDATVLLLTYLGLSDRGKMFLTQCEFDDVPPGFTFERESPRTIVAEWGEGEWIEFTMLGALRRALVFAWLWLAQESDLQKSVQSRDGAPLLQLHPHDACGPDARPHGEVTLEMWQDWLRQKKQEAPHG